MATNMLSITAITRWSVLALSFLSFPAHAGASAGDPPWTQVKPSTTGIPGSLVYWARFDPEGDLWVSARHFPWQEGGVARWNGFQWETLSTVEHPLPHEIVTSGAFAPDGSQWLGTDAGLVHRTSSGWTVYDASNSPLPASHVESVVLDAQGRVWMVYRQISTSNQGVARFDGATWAVWSHTQIGFALPMVLSNVAIDAGGDAWVGTEYAGGLARFHDGKWTVQSSAGPWASWPARILTLGGDGKLWCDWQGLRRLDGATWTKVEDLAGSHQYSALSVRADGTYWVGTYGGVLACRAPAGWKSWYYGNHLYSIDVDPADGSTWVAGLAGVRRLQPDDTWKVWISANTGLPDYFIDGIAFDPDGRAWFAQAQGGAASYDGRVWTAYHPSNFGSAPWPFATNGAEDVVVSPDGHVWLQLGYQGVGEWDGSSWKQHLQFHWTDAIALDSDGRPWAGPYQGGLARYDGAAWQKVATPPFTELNVLAGDLAGGMWMGTINGLGHYDGATWQWYVQSPGGLPSNYVTALAVHPDGSVWVGTPGGLVRFDGATWTNYTAGLPAKPISEIEIAPDGTVWVAAFDGITWPYHGGLARLGPAGWTVWTSKDSPLPHEQVTGLALDPWGNAWVGTAGEGAAIVRLGDAPFPKVWTDLGAALPGVTGTPDLAADGLLLVGEQLRVRLRDAKPNAVGFHVAGGSPLGAPFQGGVLVPYPSILVPLVTNGAGEAELQVGLLSTPPPGTRIWLQSWVLDLAGPAGVAASNAVVSAPAK